MWQAAQLDENRRQGAPLFGTRSGWMFPRRAERILFTCIHCLLDYTNGASLAVLQALRWLNGHGFSAKAFCICNHVDPESEHREALNRADMPLPTAHEADVWQTIAAGIPVTMKHIPHNDPWKVTGETRKFLAVYERLLAEQRPDVVVTYGGDCLSLAMMEAAKYRDIPIIFWLHNFGYPEQSAFQFVDRVIVPSEFSRAHHWRRVGVDCCALPNLIDWERVQVERRLPQYVTLVNPEPNKGVFVFARIAADLAARRPDIPLLVVEGRTSSAGLKNVGIDLSRFANVRIMPRTADPREFYRVTKLALMPSLWNESFGLVAAEAMINGIPVLASNRGALPEVVGEAGFLFDIPARYTPETRNFPTVDEVQPWIQTIIRLWDDPEFYVEASQRAHERAQIWHPRRLGPRYAEFFANVSPQPCPPLAPWPGPTGVLPHG
jgi:glycosyltransferase involved in cell wall biosynthesis